MIQINNMSLKASSRVTPSRAISKLCLIVGKSDYIPSRMRLMLFKWGGLNVIGKSFFGSDVTIDTIYPKLITIESDCIIATGTIILSHFFNPQDRVFYQGKVTIKDHVFIGMNTMIVAPITIGSHAVIAAGSIITKDIPAYEVWGGVPAKFIKSLSH